MKILTNEPVRILLAIASVATLLIAPLFLVPLIGIGPSSLILYSLLTPVALVAAYGYATLWRGAKRLVTGILIGLLAFAASLILGPAIPPSYQAMICALLSNQLVAVTTVVLAPIVEESLFRGVITEALKRRRGTIQALRLSSLIFTAVHAPSSAVLVAAYFIASLAVTSTYLIAGLVSSVLLHFIINLATYLNCII